MQALKFECHFHQFDLPLVFALFKNLLNAFCIDLSTFAERTCQHAECKEGYEQER